MVAVLNSLIEIDEKGVPWISGANTKVVEVVLDKLAYGWSPEEIHFQHPHLSLAQIHASRSRLRKSIATSGGSKMKRSR